MKQPPQTKPRALLIASALALATAGCTGQIIGDTGGDVVGTPGIPGNQPPGSVPGVNGSGGANGSPNGSGGLGPSNVPDEPLPSPGLEPTGREPLVGPPTRSAGARRLTRQEVARSLQRLLGADVPVDTTLLPEDTLTPFDNDVIEQSPSMRLVESSETIARDIAAWVTADPARLARVLPCTPTGPGDAACFKQFIERFGRRILRHPLDAATVTEMTGLQSYATAANNFAAGVRTALRVFLLHPEFIYRLEPGVGASNGKVKLSAFEIATRLSFLLQGMTPDDALLTAAESGMLNTPAGLLAEAKRLMAAPEGKEQLRRFVAFWFSYSTLDKSPLEKKMRQETDALVDRATDPAQDFRNLLLADDTRIDGELALHYGLTGPAPTAGMTWVNYGASLRRGILSHGMFAEAGAKFTDTSPTRRGKFVRERFLCQKVPLPTVTVDIDLPPAAADPSECKIDRYARHRTEAACAGCHALMDPIGFGLENFDELGRFRTSDKDRPDCKIDGAGQLDEKTPFTGAKELATLVANAPGFEPCVGEHFIRFASGRSLDDLDLRRAQWLGDEMKKDGHHFMTMVLAYVSHENFRVRDE
jgi:hypothetical protein